MSDITNLTTNTTINAKMNEFKGKIPSITNLATTTAFTAVGNLVKETDYNTKINEIEKKKILVMIIAITIFLHKYLTS